MSHDLDSNKRVSRVRRFTYAAAALLTFAACGDEDGPPYGGIPTGPGNPGGAGAIAIAVASSPVTITQGQTGTAAITLTRTAPFTAAAELTLEGAPTGVTGAFAPASVAAGTTTSTLTLTAATTATAGTYAATIRARGAGVSDATVPLSIVVTAAPMPAFAFTLNPTSVSVAQGASATSTATITRSGGYTGAVAFTATGAPAGVTVTVAPASATANTATVTVAAAAGAAVGSGTITLTGTGTGVANQTASLAVNVTAAPTTSATFAFCADEAPIWLAVQDGTGAWTRVNAAAANSYTFNLSADRGGVAYVTRTGAGGPTTLTVFYATAAELRGTAGGTTNVACTVGGKTVNGTATGLGPAESATIAFASASASVTAASAGGAFQLRNVPNGSYDLVAGRVATTVTGSDFSSVLNRLIVRRGLNPADNSTLAALDFNAAESFAPATANLTVGNLGADQAFTSVGLTTANGTTASFFSGAPSSAATRAYYGLPTAQLATGDLHSLTAFATSGGTGSSVRFATLYSRTVTDRTVTLGAALNAPTTSTVASTPYLRLRAQLAAQSEYNRFGGVSFAQSQGTSIVRSVSVYATGAVAGTSGFDLTIPDLTAAAGWDNAWGLQAGTATEYSVFATGGTSTGLGFLGQNPTDGATVVSASRSGNVP